MDNLQLVIVPWKSLRQSQKEYHTLCLQLLEVQQQLAVAVSAERKKDAMIEQLDKVGGYSMMIILM